MAAASGIDSFINKSVVVSMRDTRMEEISGTIKTITDNGTVIAFDSRGSSYTYNIPHSVPVYSKGAIGTVAKFVKGDEITAELQISKIVKLKGKVISTDDHGFVLQYESHNRVVQDYFPKSSVTRVTYAVLTEEGKAASAERSARMQASRTGKPVAKAGKAVATAKPALRRAA